MSEFGPSPGDESERDIHQYEVAGSEPHGVAVVRAVADQLGCDPLDVPELLYYAIDVDAVDAIFSSETNSLASNPSLSFQYCGFTVSIEPTHVELAEPNTTNQ